MKQKIKELEDELKITEGLLNEQYRVMDAIPACSVHGNRCVPHAIEWIERVKTLGEIIFKLKKND